MPEPHVDIAASNLESSLDALWPRYEQALLDLVRIPSVLGTETRAQEQVAAAARANLLLAGELAAAVDAQRPGQVELGRRRAAGAGEDVVAAVVDEPGLGCLRGARQRADRRGVDQRREFRLGLGTIDGGVGGGVDDQRRRDRAHGGGQRFRVAKVAAQGLAIGRTEGDDLAQHGQRPLQLPAELAVLAEEQDLHAAGDP